MMSWIDLHKFADVIFGITLHYIIKLGQIIYNRLGNFFKNFMHAMTVLGYLAKLIKVSGANFWCTFSAWFFYKNVPFLFNSLSMDKVSMSYLISFSRFQTKCIIKFIFRQLMTS